MRPPIDKAILKKDIADLAYNATYGANRHFATFDIVSRLPAWIGFASLAFGIVGLAFKVTTNLTSVVFILLSIAALLINMYEPKKTDYEKRAVRLTKLSGQLLSLYRKAETDDPDVLLEVNKEFLELKDAYYSDGGIGNGDIWLVQAFRMSFDSIHHPVLLLIVRRLERWYSYPSPASKMPPCKLVE